MQKLTFPLKWVGCALLGLSCASLPDRAAEIQWTSETTGDLVVPLSWTSQDTESWQATKAAHDVCKGTKQRLRLLVGQERLWTKPLNARPKPISINPTSFNRSGNYELPNSAFAPMNDPELAQNRAIPFECAPLHP